MSKYPISLIGATGLVGQTVVKLLKEHPSLVLSKVYGKEERLGSYFENGLPFLPIEEIREGELVLSMLTTEAAAQIEPKIVEMGGRLISNASFYRGKPGSTLMVVDVNGEKCIEGPICVPNCNVAGISLALRPLVEAFGVESLQVTTLQALSGAGYPGVASLDAMANVIPFIQGEEDKIEKEPNLLLERYQGFPIEISATATRVPVVNGHMAVVSMKLKRKASFDQIVEAWRTYRGLSQRLNLDFRARVPILYLDEPNFPQPRLHTEAEKGMQVTIGRLRPCTHFDWKFVMVSNNLILGAAGSSIQIAEVLTR
jgi:aspartate-semialdehyde dehydrogenase